MLRNAVYKIPLHILWPSLFTSNFFSFSDSLWLIVTLHNSNEYWMKYSRYVLKRTTYPDCFCSLDSQMATLTPNHAPLPKAPLSLLQKWMSKVQTSSFTCLLLTSAFFLSYSTWLQTQQSLTLRFRAYTLLILTPTLSQISWLRRSRKCFLS